MYSERIKVILADANQIVREGIKSLLQSAEYIEIVGEAQCIEETVYLAESLQATILIAGLNMPDFSDQRWIKAIKRVNPGIHLITLTNKTESTLVRKLLRAGIKGYLLKSAQTKELEAAICAVAGGGFYIHEQLKDIFMERLISPTPVDLLEEVCISKREREILNLIASEYVNNEIANQLCISIHTVETHRKKLLQKTKTRNTAGLVRYAVENGIV